MDVHFTKLESATVSEDGKLIILTIGGTHGAANWVIPAQVVPKFIGQLAVMVETATIVDKDKVDSDATLTVNHGVEVFGIPGTGYWELRFALQQGLPPLRLQVSGQMLKDLGSALAQLSLDAPPSPPVPQTKN